MRIPSTAALIALAASSGAPGSSVPQEPSGDQEAPAVLWHEARVLLPTRVFHPPDFDPERDHTLIVGFHGYGGSAQGFAAIAKALADMGFLVALPESGYPLLADRELGFDWFLNEEREELGLRASKLLMFDQIPTMLAGLEENYSIDRIYTLGFSQGAVAALGTAIFQHEHFAGAISFGLPEFSSEWLPGDSLSQGKGVRLLFLHGREDTVAPLSASEETLTLFSDADYEATLQVFSGGHAVPQDQLEHVADWIWQ